MSALNIILSAVLFILSIVIVGIVLFQEGHDAGISGAIAGGADTFLGKSKGHTLDQVLSKWTKILAIVFFIIVIAADFATLFAR